MAKDRKAYMRELMRKKRANKQSANKTANSVSKKAVSSPESVSTIKWHPEIDQSMFDGHGRGAPVNGYVLIALGRNADPECGVVTKADWLTRLSETCSHGWEGWTCKECLG